MLEFIIVIVTILYFIKNLHIIYVTIRIQMKSRSDESRNYFMFEPF